MYQIPDGAQHEIDRALKEQLTELNLSDYGLEILPDSITQLVNLKKLNLSHNYFTDVPEVIGKLHNLHSLDLSWNDLQNVPKSISNLPNLISLDLSYNSLEILPVWIKDMKDLKTLNFNGNAFTSIPEWVGQLRNLTSLNLSHSGLKNVPKWIGNLPNLASLDLSYNSLQYVPTWVGEMNKLAFLNINGNLFGKIPPCVRKLSNLNSLKVRQIGLKTVPEWIAGLIKLTSLDLSHNQVDVLPESIARLPKLTSLDLSQNQLKSIPESISKLTNLLSLSLSQNQLKNIPESISELTNLLSLDLSQNQLKNIPESISELTNLLSLDLSQNQLEALPVSIGKLHRLEQLDLQQNKLKVVQDEIKVLSNLEALNLSQNQIAKLPDWLGELENLTELYIGTNLYNHLPSNLKKLKKLKSLDIGQLNLKDLPDWLLTLNSLKRLNLSGNNFRELPESFAQLDKLTILYLSAIGLTKFPQVVCKLNSLQVLVLKNAEIKFFHRGWSVNFAPPQKKYPNYIETIPREILNLVNLKEIMFDEEQITFPPPEIILDQRKDRVNFKSIKSFFDQLDDEGIDQLFEAKLLVVGEPGAGKTTLTKKLQDIDYPLQEEISTKGIDILQWHFLMHDSREFRVNIWDFGGQEIYHATHQFFLTKRSFYILVADTRKEDTDFYYWLNMVELLSDSSPIFIIKNEKQDRHREINERQLRGQFTNLKEIFSANLATNRGLQAIFDEIKHDICHLPHIGTPLPKTWVVVREKLETDQRNYISLEEFLVICEQNGFHQQQDKLQLSSYLHDLGVCLHFQDDPLLNKTVILKPQWGTEAVYKVLDNHQVIRNLGRFTRDDLKKIWFEDIYNNMHNELLQLMLNFKLSYRIPDSEFYIAPQLLSENQPDYLWDETNNLIVRYTYDFMPKGILTVFTVKMHNQILDDKFVWKSGVILEKDETQAEVIEYYGKRELSIRVTGKHKKQLMTIVTYELDRIHDSFNRLKYHKLIPCNCEKCKENSRPHFYRFSVLQNAMAASETQIQCQQYFVMVDVRKLIDDVTDPFTHKVEVIKSRLADTRMGRELIDRPSYNNVQMFIQHNYGEGNTIEQSGVKEINMTKKSTDKATYRTPWLSGSFYLFAFIVVIAGFGVLANSVPPLAFGIIAVMGVIIPPILGALQLRQDDRLSEKNFLQLIQLSYAQLPLVGQIAKLFGKQQ